MNGSHADTHDGAPRMLVAVCGAGACGRRCARVIDALRPVIRAEPAAILMRTTCLDPRCRDGGPDEDPAPRVRVQPWADRDGPRRGRVCDIKAVDPEACARTVGSWLRSDRLWGVFHRPWARRHMP